MRQIYECNMHRTSMRADLSIVHPARERLGYVPRDDIRQIRRRLWVLAQSRGSHIDREKSHRRGPYFFGGHQGER